MEFNENDLDHIVGGISYDEAVEIAKGHPELFKTNEQIQYESDELTEEQLQNIKAGYPYAREEDKPKSR